jgi:DNA-binding transcriptional ArsR family regulator
MNPDYAKSLPQDWEPYARFFSALGDTYRQQILLIFEPGEELCVNEIAAGFALSRPAISHHLKVLRDAGLLTSEKRGKEVYYRVNHSFCAEVLQQVHDFVASNAGPVTPTLGAASA